MPPTTTTQTDQLHQIVERLDAANNILITVSADPSVDQLAACIGLTLALNKKGKHATAVFSGAVPSTLEFLQPEQTIEKNTNSLRDFIISLDKSKADKLRYKVEDDFVKIFITPYRTSIDNTDLAFSQGDFNIDLVITLGVHERQHLDAAIIAHGRILHDAPVISLNTDTISDLGAVNWVETNASSLCEMTSDLVLEVGRELLDAQISTALLTGMVAETDRFGNEKATPHTMSVSGVLMAAGASPQLITAKLTEPEPEPEPEEEPEAPEVPEDELPAVVDEPLPEPETEEPEVPEPKNDGVFEIDHTQDDNIKIDDHGRLEAVKDLEEAEASLAAEAEAKAKATESATSTEDQSADSKVERGYIGGSGADEPKADAKLVLDPPQLGGRLTANSVPEHQQYSPSTDPLSVAASPAPLLDRTESSTDQTLSDLERAIGSPHVEEQDPSAVANPDAPEMPSVDQLQANVTQAINANDTYKPEPINALGASNVDLGLGHDPMDQIIADEAADSGQAPQAKQEGTDKPAPPVPPPFPGV